MKELREIADAYLDDEMNFVSLTAATIAFKRYLEELTPLDLSDEVYRSDIHLDSGLAIATEWAVRCIDDLERTKTFIKGTAEAIEDVLHRRAGPVHLLYAGTGPYATLVLPLMSVFTPEQLQLSLIEINDQSCQSVRHIFNQPAFAPYLQEILQGNASTLQLKQPEAYDILLSETMQNTLKREPQVPITVNLLRQLRPDTLLVPQRITVHLAAVAVKYQDRIWVQKSTTLGRLMESSREALTEHLKNDSKELTFSKAIIEIAAEQLEGKSSLALVTDIHVFGSQYLRFGKSGLTIPDHILNLDELKNTDITFQARYELLPEPGIVWSV